MTARAPVVIGADGLTQQLQAGDILQGLGGVINKTTDESRNTTTTVTADGALVATLAAGTWRVRVMCFFDNTAGATPGFKFDMNFTGTGTWGPRRHRTYPGGTVSSSAAETQTMGTGTLSAVSLTAGAAGPGYVEFEGVIVVTVSGSVQFRWAQNTSNAIAVVVKAGSYLEYALVA